jgi:glutathione S-transferase
MKIYYSPVSSNSRKVRIAAHLLGVNLELVEIDLARGEQRKPSFLEINPNGKLPVLVDGDFVLSESNAIMAYLADKTAGQKLYPTELHARAEVNKWLFWGSSHWSPAISTLTFERMIKKVLGKGEPDPSLVAHGEAMFAQWAKVLDAHLAQRDWIVGSTLTLADVAIGSALMVAGPAQLPMAGYSAIGKWFGRVQDLEAWRKTGT